MAWLVGAILLHPPLLLAANPIQNNAPDKEVELLMERVGPPSPLAIKTFEQAGMLEVKPHTLTSDERLKVERALVALPALHQRVLLDKLDHLAFVDGIPGEGTGLTSPGEHAGHYDITLRASLINESLSTFLTTKERRDFSSSGGETTVTMDGQGVDALHYVLLHESTHVVDRTCHITDDKNSLFTAGIWIEAHKLVPSLASTVLNETYFRTGKPFGIEKAATVYDALSKSPFVSLYSTASSAEDFAELVAWHEVRRDGGALTIELGADAQWRPLAFAGVDKRFKYVDDLLAHPRRYGCANYAS
ncbi:hypothetical protein GCM10010872_14410 [Dyella flava]|nr:hypothetical protein GCM10010872_14410 [Dyella flava]